MKSYGICFVEDEDSCNQHFKNVKAEVKPQSKARFITMQDLRDVPQGGEFQIHAGDVLTALAKEYVEKFGIRIVEE